jgi:predicted ATPase
MRELGRIAELEKFWVRNFKSLRDLTLDVPTKLTVVIGYNGSGKTALVEVFELLTYVLDWKRGVIANPFARFWGYDKVVWRHNEDLPVTIGFKLRLTDIQRKVQEIESENLKKILEYIRHLLPTPMEIDYELDVTGRGGDFRVLRENIVVYSKDLKVATDTVRSTLTVTADVLKELNNAFEEIREVAMEVEGVAEESSSSTARSKTEDEFPEDLLKSGSKYIKRGLLRYKRLLSELGVVDRIIRRKEIESLSRNQIGLAYLLTLYAPEFFTVQHSVIEFSTKMEERYSALDISATAVIRYLLFPEDYILGKQGLSNLVESIGRRLLINTSSPRYQKILEYFKELEEEDLENVHSVVRKVLSYLIARRLLHRVSGILFTASATVYGFIDGICVVKDIDWKSVKTPQSVERQERLKPDGSNFIPFLFTLTGGNVGMVFDEVLKYAFPGSGRVRVGFDITTDSRIFLRLTTEDGVRLTPISIPHGVLKTLIIESLLRWRPTLLVVDEFENSLHPELQQFLIDEIRTSGVNAIITSHSTVPVNYVRDLREVVVLRLERGETKVYRLSEEVRERIRETRLTLSDLLLSGLLRPEVSG